MNVPLVEAGELMAKRNGSVDPAKFSEEVFELHSIPAFDAGKPDVVSGRKIGSAKQIVQPNDVMISKIVPHIRRGSIVGAFSGHRQIASSEWIVFRSDRLYPNYMRQLLVSDWFNAEFMRTVSGVGGSLLRARPAEVAKIKIPLPSLPEQRRIAAILDKADALRAKRREAIAKLDQLLQSLFLDMFGDPVTNPKGWPVTTIGENCEKVTVGIVVKPASYYAEKGVPALRSLNIGVNKIVEEKFVYFSEADNSGLLKKTILRAGDVVAVRSGQPGKAAVVPARLDGINAIDVLIARTKRDRMQPEFLARFLNSPAGKALVLAEQRGQVQKHLNVKQLSEAKVPVPPIALQDQFLKKAEYFEGLQNRVRLATDRCEALFTTIQQRGFTGAL